MRIISKYHDYYDTAMSYGMDNEILFLRKLEKIINSPIPEELLIIWKKLPKYNWYWKDVNDLTIEPFIIVFCGIIHIGYILSGITRIDRRSVNYTIPDIYVYGLDSLEKILQQYNPKKYECFLCKPLRGFDLVSVSNAFKEFQDKQIEMNIHIEEKAPILYIGSRKRDLVYIKNPILRDIQFYKKVDAFTAFQNLAMFIGGVVSKTSPPMVELSEKNRIEKQGFDKWSFRKMRRNSK